MTNFFIPQENEALSKRALLVLTGSFSLSVLATVIGLITFPLQAGLISVFLASFSMLPVLDAVLEKNKNDIWQKRMHPAAANGETLFLIVLMFLGTTLSYFACVMALPQTTSDVVFFSQTHDTMTHLSPLTVSFQDILFARGKTAVIFFVMSLIYRMGSLFVLVWMASVWGITYGFHFNGSLPESITQVRLGLTHPVHAIALLVRFATFSLFAMGGLFLSKGLSKYGFKSPQLKQVLRAVTVIVMVAVGGLLLGSALESFK